MLRQVDRKTLFIFGAFIAVSVVLFGAGWFVGFGRGEDEVMSVYPLGAAYGEVDVANKMRDGCADEALALLDEKILMRIREGGRFHAQASARGLQIYNELMPGLQKYMGQKTSSRVSNHKTCKSIESKEK